MDIRPFGTTGLRVSALGYGAGNIGTAQMSEGDVARLLGAVLDAGVTLIDTARSYGASEERIGRHLAHRRSEFLLSTKVGYGVEGFEDWTGPCVQAGIERALRTLRTEVIDIVHLHSCDVQTLRHGGVVEALWRAKQAGQVRVVAYSGEGDALAEAIDAGLLESLQASINVCDQRIVDHALGRAKARGMGVLAKRPLANAPWRWDARPTAPDAALYWDRWQAMRLGELGIEPSELALRFAAWTWGVDCCMVATTRHEHLHANVAAVERGKLPDDVVQELRERFRRHDRGWVGVI
ncbi:MAG: aldo/keto reductase [Myxococcota bacterium]